jgi:hypothetical protein
MEKDYFRQMVIGHISFLTKVSKEKIADNMRLIRDLKLRDWKLKSLFEFVDLYSRQKADIVLSKIRNLTVENLIETYWVY